MLQHYVRTAFLISAPLIRPTALRAPAPLMVKFPESPKEVATEMSLAVQAALSDGKRRLEIALPDGLQFGLFGQPPGKQELGDPDYDPPAVQTQRADIELAYLAAEIFQKLGEGVACVLPDATALEQAERCWTKGGTPLRTRLVGSAAELDGKPAGFGGSRGAAVSDAPLRVLLVLRSKKATLAALEPIVAPMGDEVLVLLLNPARLKSGGTRSGYTPTFVLRDNPHPGWRGGLLYRRYPQQWGLGVGAARGRAVVHGRSEQQPTLDEIEVAFEKIKSDTSLISTAGGLLSASGAAAALERRMPVA